MSALSTPYHTQKGVAVSKKLNDLIAELDICLIEGRLEKCTNWVSDMHQIGILTKNDPEARECLEEFILGNEKIHILARAVAFVLLRDVVGINPQCPTFPSDSPQCSQALRWAKQAVDVLDFSCITAGEGEAVEEES